MSPRFFGFRFAALFLAGFMGVLSTLWVPLNLPAEVELPVSEGVIRLVGLIQSGILLLMAIVIGQLCAPRVGLRAPLVDALVSRQPVAPLIRRQLLPGLLWGLVSAVLIGQMAAVLSTYLPAVFVAAGEQNSPGLAVRLLYGGITEEILLRWGMMSLLAWLMWRVFQGGRGDLARASAWTANALAALLFGAAHLPAAAALAGQAGLTPFLIVYIIGLNALFGLGAGWLYWRKGLESAIFAHMAFHIVVVGGTWLTGFF